MGNNKFIRQVILPLVTALTIAANLGVDAVRLNGVSTAQISDSFKNLFVPAGYVFAVWGVIYIGLIAYSVYQALPAQLANPRLKAIVPLYLLSCVANVLWLTFFHFYQFGLAMIMIVVLLLCLIGCYANLRSIQTLQTSQTLQTPQAPQRPADTREVWFAHVPFSIYLGWVTVATIANATQFLVFLKWDGFGISPETWTVVMIAVGVFMGLVMFATQRDVAYLLVLAWAFSGIGYKQAGLFMVARPAWVALGFMVMLAIAAAVEHSRRLVAMRRV